MVFGTARVACANIMKFVYDLRSTLASRRCRSRAGLSSTSAVLRDPHAIQQSTSEYNAAVRSVCQRIALCITNCQWMQTLNRLSQWQTSEQPGRRASLDAVTVTSCHPPPTKPRTRQTLPSHPRLHPNDPSHCESRPRPCLRPAQSSASTTRRPTGNRQRQRQTC